jgi:hypothetical protein
MAKSGRKVLGPYGRVKSRKFEDQEVIDRS